MNNNEFKDAVNIILNDHNVSDAIENNDFKKVFNIIDLNYTIFYNYDFLCKFIDLLTQALPDFKDYYKTMFKDKLINAWNFSTIEDRLINTNDISIDDYRYAIVESMIDINFIHFLIYSDTMFTATLEHSKYYNYEFFKNAARELINSLVLADKMVYADDTEDIIRPFILNNKDYVIMNENNVSIYLDDMNDIVHFKTYQDAQDYIDNVLFDDDFYVTR